MPTSDTGEKWKPPKNLVVWTFEQNFLFHQVVYIILICRLENLPLPLHQFTPLQKIKFLLKKKKKKNTIFSFTSENPICALLLIHTLSYTSRFHDKQIYYFNLHYLLSLWSNNHGCQLRLDWIFTNSSAYAISSCICKIYEFINIHV